MGSTKNFWKGIIWRSVGIILISCILIPTAPQPIYPNKIDTFVTVKDNPGIAIPQNFVGFSIEMSQVCEILQLDAQNPSYGQLYKNLGSSTLRIGGDTADFAEWSPYGKFVCNPYHTVVTQTMINAVFAFAHKINWKIIWELNFASNNPVSAANEAAYMTAAGGSTLIGFSIGNEPELYTKRGLRPSWWAYQNYRYEWERYRNMILQRVPGKFVGPDACCETAFFSHFLKDEGSKGIIIASHHFYPIARALTGDNAPSIPLLLSQQVLTGTITLLTGWIDIANRYGLPLELTEVNSVPGGGMLGVSNTLAAALWANDFLFQAAKKSVEQVDFHSSCKASYNAIDDYGNPTPLYYGLLLFHYAARHSYFLEADIHTKTKITAYALKGVDGTVSVVLINKDMNNNSNVEINAGLYSHATAIYLTASDNASTTKVTLGQRATSQQGIWAPNPVMIATRGKMGYVEVPAESAAVVMFS